MRNLVHLNGKLRYNEAILYLANLVWPIGVMGLWLFAHG